MKTIWNFLKAHKPAIFLVLIVLLALKVFVPQIDELKESIAALKEADPAWILAGIVVFFSGVPILAWQYLELALKPIPFFLTLRVQMAGLFVSKLLPSSLGTLTLNMYYLTQMKHSVTQSTTVMTTNAITSGIAYAILIILALIATGFSLRSIDFSNLSIPIGWILLILFGVVLLCYVLYKIPKIHNKIHNVLSDMANDMKYYKDKPKAVVMGILLNGIGSATSVFAMYATAHAVGVDLTIPNALLAYTFGNIAMALVPTPGGLGAAEAGIYSGLLLVGVDAADALIITLLYRLITYWIPILPGYYYFWSLRKNVLSNFSIKSKPATE